MLDPPGDRATAAPQDATARREWTANPACQGHPVTGGNLGRTVHLVFRDCRVHRVPKVDLDLQDYPDTRDRPANRGILDFRDQKGRGGTVEGLAHREMLDFQVRLDPKDHKD